jgi:steroid delta-isomerase-like uncharacterized protein
MPGHPAQAGPKCEEEEVLMAVDQVTPKATSAGERFARDFADRWQKAWNSRDPDQVTALCTDDVVWDDPMTEQPERGHQAVAEYLCTVWRAFPDLEFTWPEGPFASFHGIKLALHWSVTGTMTGPMDPPGFAPTGRRIRLDGVDLLEIREGLCSNYQGFFDTQAVAQQVGVAPARGSQTERMAVGAQRLLAAIERRRRR